MAVPKRRTSASKRNIRRSANEKIATLPNATACKHCGEPRLPHRVCSSCGYYKDHQVLKGCKDVSVASTSDE